MRRISLSQPEDGLTTTTDCFHREASDRTGAGTPNVALRRKRNSKQSVIVISSKVIINYYRLIASRGQSRLLTGTDKYFLI
jgi:hypothetical protein